MNTEKTKGGREKAKSSAFGFSPMGGISEMMTKCRASRGSFPDCLTMMKEMKKKHCAPSKDAAESERKKK
jgi:pentatricopeptide repeat protein